MRMPSLMLQKPHAKSKANEDVACLQCRLSLWEKGDILNLLKEERVLQMSLASFQPPKRHSEDTGLIAHRFSKKMMDGWVSQILKRLSNNSDASLFDEIVDGTSGKIVRDVLEDKDPDPRSANQEALLEIMESEL